MFEPDMELTALPTLVAVTKRCIALTILSLILLNTSVFKMSLNATDCDTIYFFMFFFYC